MVEKKRPPRPSALVRAQHGGSPVKLDAAQRAVLAEALRRGQELIGETEAKVASYGEWLLTSVFGGNATEALDPRTANPVWVELERRAGGPTLGIGRSALYKVLRIAAYDHRITDLSWRKLGAGWKELLLPLASDEQLRAAARHVADFKLTQVKTREYVTQLLSEGGKGRQVRVTAPVLSSRIRRLRESLATPAVLRRVRGFAKELTAEERTALTAEVEELRGALTDIVKAIRSR